MLQDVWTEEGMEGEELVVGQTTGCGCCTYNVHGKVSVTDELKNNMKFILKSCQILGITLEELKTMVEEK